MGTKG